MFSLSPSMGTAWALVAWGGRVLSFPPYYLLPSVAPVQPGRQGLPVTGPDSISVPTYSLSRVYVLLFSVGVLLSWWCSSTSLRNGIPIRRCRTWSLGPRRVWTLFFILFQVLLAIATLFKIHPCVRQDYLYFKGLCCTFNSRRLDWRHPSPD